MDIENYNRAATYCSKSEHCKYDVLQKLYEWRVDESEHEEIIARLVEERFIDENRYAVAYAKDKFAFNKWGRVKISIMLKAKRIGSADIDEALSSIDDDKYFETLKTLIDQQRPKVKAKSEYELNAKLFKFALSHGYESGIISSLLSFS